jgi:hypothetical protein
VVGKGESVSKFVFKVYRLVPGTRCTFVPVEVTTVAATFAAALVELESTHPGHGIAEHTRGLWKVVGEK